MTTHHSFFQRKPGQGCTTTAALFALQLPGLTLLVDRAGGDLAPALGVTGAEVVTSVCTGLDLAPPGVDHWPDIYDHVVYDYGTTTPETLPGRRHLVTRACYLALRRAIEHAAIYDDVILVAEPLRALRAADIEAALGKLIAVTVPYDPAISRAVDAGLLATRRGSTLPTFNIPQEETA